MCVCVCITLFSELFSPTMTKTVLDSSQMVIPINLGGGGRSDFAVFSQLSLYYKMLLVLLR